MSEERSEYELIENKTVVNLSNPSMSGTSKRGLFTSSESGRRTLDNGPQNPGVPQNTFEYH